MTEVLERGTMDRKAIVRCNGCQSVIEWTEDDFSGFVQTADCPVCGFTYFKSQIRWKSADAERSATRILDPMTANDRRQLLIGIGIGVLLSVTIAFILSPLFGGP